MSLEEAVARLLRALEGECAKVRVLRLLAARGPLSMREVARGLGLSFKTAARHLEELEEAGLVRVLYGRPNMKLYHLSELALRLEGALRQP